MLHRCALMVALAISLPISADAVRGGALGVPLPLFPANNWWNTDVSAAPVDGNSANFINFIGPGDQPHPDFGGEDGAFIYGFPYIVVDGSQPKKAVSFDYSDESDGVDHDTDTPFPFYPIPNEAITQSGWIEGGPAGNVDISGDRHILIVDKTNNHLYELYDVYYNGASWEAGSGAFFDMNTNARRPEGWTSADAAGLAILPGLVRYDEVYGPDEIRHAFRVTVRATNGHVYPASHTAGGTAGALPMGARLRLKADVDVSAAAPALQKVFRAMKRYGLIVADNGSDMFVSGTHDTRWDMDVVHDAFDLVTAADFEVIQLGWAPPVSLVLSLPSNVGAGDAADATLTARNVDDDVVTNYTGTVRFSSTDGAATLPVDYTFTLSDGGTHTFPANVILRTPGSQVVTVKDLANATITGSAGVTVGPATPANLLASATSPTSIGVSWSPSAGAVEYELSRRTSAGGWTVIATTASTGFNDAPVASGAAFAYRVRALDAADRASAFSVPDAATTVAFTDDPVTAGATTVKVAHVNQLRSAANALRAVAGLAPFDFTDSTLAAGTRIKSAHMANLRTAVAEARDALGLTSVTFTDASLAGVMVKAVHVNQLRSAVR